MSSKKHRKKLKRQYVQNWVDSVVSAHDNIDAMSVIPEASRWIREQNTYNPIELTNIMILQAFGVSTTNDRYT